MITESAVLIISFFIVVALLFKPLRKMLKKSITQYCINIDDNVSKSYEDMELSRVQFSLMVEKNKNIEDKVAQILNAARLEAKLATNKNERDLEAFVRHKLQQEKSKILHKNSLTIQELKKRVINISAHCTYKLTTLKLNDEATQASVINFAIEQVPDKIH